ncbi:PKD domain-containing protein, partial [Zobellia roscoffensis]
ASYAWTQVSGPTTATIAAPGSVSTSVTSLTEGSYTFRLTVTDDGTPALSDTDDIIVTVNPAPNDAPVAVATFSQRTGILGYIIEFTGSNSTDSNSDPLTYSWVFGDGNTSNIANPNHTYSSAGIYNASLTVSDGELSDTFTFTVNPRNFVIIDPSSSVSYPGSAGGSEVMGTITITGTPVVFTLIVELITGIGANASGTLVIDGDIYNSTSSQSGVQGIRSTSSYTFGVYDYSLEVNNPTQNSGVVSARVVTD